MLRQYLNLDKTILFEDARRLLNENYLLKPKKYFINILGKQFIQYSDVFPSDVFEDTNFFTNLIEVSEGEQVLEIGVGNGISSVMFALKGAQVTGVDINLSAVYNAIENANIHGVAKKTNFFVSDVLQNIGPNCFDIIYWNVPFCMVDTEPSSMLERSIFDYNYSSLKNFILNSKTHLSPKGKLYIGFSNTYGEADLLEDFCDQAGYNSIQLVSEKLIEKDEFTYDLSLYQIKNTK